MRSTHAALIAAAVLFFGLKGLLGGALLWYLYASSQQAQQAQAPQGSQQERMASVQQFFSGMLNEARPGQGGVAAAGPGTSGSGAAQQAKDPWAGRGKPRKLSES